MQHVNKLAETYRVYRTISVTEMAGDDLKNARTAKANERNNVQPFVARLGEEQCKTNLFPDMLREPKQVLVAGRDKKHFFQGSPQEI